MSDEQRPELEWPSEDLARPGGSQQPKSDVEWPSTDQAKATTTPASEEPATPAKPPVPVEPPKLPEPPVPAEPPGPPAPTVPEPPVVPEPEPPPSAAPAAPVQPAAPEPPPAPQAPAPPPEPAWPEEPKLAEPAAVPPPAVPPPVEPAPVPPPVEPAAVLQDLYAPQEPLTPADPLATPPPAYVPPGVPPVGPAQPGPTSAFEEGYQVPPDYRGLPGGEQPGTDAFGQPTYPPGPDGDHGAGYLPPPTGYPPAAGGYVAPPVPVSTAPGPYATAGGLGASGHDESGADGKRSYFRKDIEGLRAVAIIAVLLFHVGIPYTDGGFVGVDVFYVISGFLITGLLLREGEESGKVDLIRFYARRMRRLLPAALLVIVVTLVLSSVIVSPLRLTEIAGDAAASALYVANFRFAFEATDYLATEAQSPLLHYWSLGVEEQFYLVWPLLLLAATRILSLRWVGLFLLVLAVGSFALSFYWTDANPAWAFYSPVTRAWELAAGALIAVGLLRIPRRIPGWAGGIAVMLGLALIVASVVLITETLAFPGYVALLPVLGAVLVIVGGMRGPTLAGRIVLGNPLSRYIGRISYSLYLWHWPLLILVPIAIENDELSIRIGLAGVAVVLAALTTEIVERPFRRSSVLAQRSRVSIELGLAGSVAVGVAALFMAGTITLPANIPAPWLRPDPVVVELAGVREDIPAHDADGCSLRFEQRKLKTDCVYGDLEGEKTAMLIGDSHAAQWMPAIDLLAKEEGWRLEVHTKNACAIPDVPIWERKFSREFDECISWREALMKRVRKTKPDAVFLGLSRDYELWDNGRIVQSRQALGYWQDKLTELLATLDNQADRVVLLAETPFLNYDPVDCLADDDIANCDPAKSLALDRRYAELEATAADDAGVDLLSVNELLCPEASCPVVIDDIVVYRDHHHLTASFMEHIATPIGRLLDGKSPYPSPSPSRPPEAASPVG